ncbi:MAG: hypothetical protein WDN24_11565 [Sphingomonas sp.]
MRTSPSTLADGTALRAAELSGAVNRVTAVPQAHLARAAPADRAYATGELHAFMLAGSPRSPARCSTRPRPKGWRGRAIPKMAARHFAVQVGFACAPLALALDDALDPPPRPPGTDTHVVLDGRVIGAIVPTAAREAMLQFAQLWGGRMVQIETRRHGGARHFVAATSLVDFPRGGALLVRAMLKLLAA